MKDAFEVLMITHGNLCKGYIDALKVILDIEDDDLHTLSFELGQSLDDFSNQIENKVNKELIEDNVVVLLDLPGGSPSNVSLPFISTRKKYVAGINLPFVLELMIQKKNGVTWDNLNIEEIIRNAANSMVFYNKILKMGE